MNVYSNGNFEPPYAPLYQEVSSYYRLESVKEESQEISAATSVTESSQNGFIGIKGSTPVKMMGASFVDLNTLDVVGESSEYLEQDDECEEEKIEDFQTDHLEKIKLKKSRTEQNVRMKNTLWKNFS
jgi:hypothetical protein